MLRYSRVYSNLPAYKAGAQWTKVSKYGGFWREFHAGICAGMPQWNGTPYEIIRMPSLSPSMETGKVVRWAKEEGDEVPEGEMLAEVETDKAVVSFDSPMQCYLAKILVPSESEPVPLDSPIAITVSSRELVEKMRNFTLDAQDQASEHHPSEELHEDQPEQQQQETQNEPSHPTEPETLPKTHQPVSSEPQRQNNDGDQQILASPYAKFLSKKHGVDLTGIQGTGPRGRIIANDIKLDETHGENAQLETHWENMVQGWVRSKKEVPHYYLTVECNVDNILQMKESINNNLMSNGGDLVDLQDFIIKASAMATRSVTQINSQWRGDSVIRNTNIDVNVAIYENDGICIAPVIENADFNGLASISRSIRSFKEKIKNNNISSRDLKLGALTVSILPHVTSFSSIITPPQSSYLSVGDIQQKIVYNPESSQFCVVNIVNVTLSCDHRVVDGAVGAQWIDCFKSYVENPLKLIL